MQFGFSLPIHFNYMQELQVLNSWTGTAACDCNKTT